VTFRSKVFGLSTLLAVVVAALLLASRVFEPFGYAALPFAWPAILLLGGDETYERYGQFGTFLLDWILSLPCVILYSWLYCRWRYRARV
jgi:hypothetical protein